MFDLHTVLRINTAYALEIKCVISLAAHCCAIANVLKCCHKTDIGSQEIASISICFSHCIFAKLIALFVRASRVLSPDDYHVNVAQNRCPLASDAIAPLDLSIIDVPFAISANWLSGVYSIVRQIGAVFFFVCSDLHKCK